MTSTAPTPARPWPAQALRRHPRPRRVRPRGRARHHPRPAGPQRRRQDHRGPRLRHPHPLRRRRGPRRRARRTPRGDRRAAGDRPRRPDDRARRGALRPREPRPARPPARADQGRGRAPGPTSCSATFGLDDAGDRKVSTYSGGMRRRLDIAASLIRRPACSSSTSRPPGSTRAGAAEVWATVRQVVDARHHRAAHHPVPRRGRPARRPDHRDGRRQGDRRGHLRGAQEPARRRPGDRHRPGRRRPRRRSRELLGGTADEETREVTVEAGPAGGTAALLAAVGRSTRAGIEVDDVLLRRPTLDEVFLHLTDRPPPEAPDDRHAAPGLDRDPARPQALGPPAVDADLRPRLLGDAAAGLRLPVRRRDRRARRRRLPRLPAARHVRADDAVRRRDAR